MTTKSKASGATTTARRGRKPTVKGKPGPKPKVKVEAEVKAEIVTPKAASPAKEGDEDRRYGTSNQAKLTRPEVREAAKANAEDGKTRLYPDLSTYEQVKLDNRKIIDNGDEVAKRLREVEPEDIYTVVASVMGEEVAADWAAKYKHLNPGMQRMNVGNRLRGHFNRLTKEVEAKAAS